MRYTVLVIDDLENVLGLAGLRALAILMFPIKCEGLLEVMRLKAMDLFCGCGGLTVGLKRAKFSVVGAIEKDPLACEAYRMNHPRTRLFEGDICEISPEAVLSELGLDVGELDLLAGCPPCQGFSTIRTKNRGAITDEPMNDLVFEFERYVRAMRPRSIMMENVPGLASDLRSDDVIASLEKLGYRCDIEVFNAAEFGAPQRRKRMILIGSTEFDPRFASASKRRRTVRAVIGKLPSPAVSADPLHNYTSRRSEGVQTLIEMVPRDGGSRTDLPEEMQLDCHRKCDGFKDVYGRMAWDAPSPTITGGCINPSKGRFLHPEEHRAITLREAAMLQGFPANYKLPVKRGRFPLAQLIGNAFPPIFAQKHAAVLREDLMQEN